MHIKVKKKTPKPKHPWQSAEFARYFLEFQCKRSFCLLLDKLMHTYNYIISEHYFSFSHRLITILPVYVWGVTRWHRTWVCHPSIIMAEMVAMKLDYWRRHNNSIMAAAFPTTKRFFQNTFRWNIKSCYIQHLSTKQTPKIEQINGKFSFFFCLVSQRPKQVEQI